VDAIMDKLGRMQDWMETSRQIKERREATVDSSVKLAWTIGTSGIVISIVAALLALKALRK
jgi:hypothetical protein